MNAAHHLKISADELAGNDGLGRYVLLPGDPSRAARIARSFEQQETFDNPRGLAVHIGRLPGDDGSMVDVAAVATGIGTAAVEVVVSELITSGARRLLRVGSCGTMTPAISPGQVVIATGAVRDEETSRHYAPLEYPALPHRDGVEALIEGAERAGLADETFLGLCHSKASLYAREFGHGPAGEANLAYADWLRRCGVVASEMEASALFVLASTYAPTARPLSAPPADDCRAAAVLAVFASDDSQMHFDAELASLAEERVIRVAIEGVRAWATRDAGRA